MAAVLNAAGGYRQQLGRNALHKQYYLRGRRLSIKYIKHELFAVTSFIAMMNLAQAEESQPDKFRLAIGGYNLARYESNISMTESNLGAGISISPQDTLGIDIEGVVLRIEGYYRFSPDHSLTYS